MMGDKIWLKPDNEHWFDYLFLQDDLCEMPFDEHRVEELVNAVEQELNVW